MRENLVEMYMLTTNPHSQHLSGHYIIKNEFMNFECVAWVALTFPSETQANICSPQLRHPQKVGVMIHQSPICGQGGEILPNLWPGRRNGKLHYQD